MTKKQFITLAKKQGFKNYKEFVEILGYNKRTLDRYKMEDVLTSKFMAKVEEYVKTAIKPPKEVKPKKKAIKKNVQVVNKKSAKKETKKEEPKDSIGIDISNEEYHKSDKLSVSKIKLIFDNAKEFYHRYVLRDAEQKETDALIIGTVFHSLVLEPEKFDTEYLVIDMPNRPIKNNYVEAIEKLGGEIYKAQNNSGKIVVKNTVEELKAQYEELKKDCERKVITSSQYEIAQKLATQALNSHIVMETVNSITGEVKTHFDFKLEDILKHENCVTEKTFYGKINDEDVQIRTDILFNMSAKGNFWLAIDLKSAIDGTERTFINQIATHKYDIQDYVYTEILKQNGINLHEFRFCVAGKDEFSDASFYTIRKDETNDTAKVVSKIIDKYKYCKESNLWKSTPFDYKLMRYETTKTLEMPMWAKYKYIEMGVL